MNLIAKKYPHIKGGFMHIPYAVEQGIGKDASTPTMALPTIARGIEAAAACILKDGEELKVNEGATH
jgi:pyroglutamyl-peptidase